MARERTEWVNVRLTDNEADMLRALVEEEGITASKLIRSLLQRAYADTARRRAMTRARPAKSAVRVGKETPR